MEEKGYDPLVLTREVEKKVAKNSSRLYARFRATRFYGGIATGDVIGCNLRCIFCWASHIRDNYSTGFWVSPEESYRTLTRIARSKGFNRVRLSAGEPTIGFNHLLSLLDLFEENGRYLFILETNGIVLGAFREYARKLKKYSFLHVRISIKACNEYWFHKLTLARPSAFQYQLKAVENLLDEGVSFHVSIVASFGGQECWASLFNRLSEIDPRILETLEVEVVKLYPHVVKSLKKHGVWPERSYLL